MYVWGVADGEIRECIGSGPPKPSSQHKGDLFASEGRRTGNKRKRQETEDEGEGKGTKERGEGYFSQKNLWIEGSQTWHIGKWQFIKIQGGNPVLG